MYCLGLNKLCIADVREDQRAVFLSGKKKNEWLVFLLRKLAMSVCLFVIAPNVFTGKHLVRALSIGIKWAQFLYLAFLHLLILSYVIYSGLFNLCLLHCICTFAVLHLLFAQANLFIMYYADFDNFIYYVLCRL